MRKRLHIEVSGKVQGVYFRQSTADTARALSLTGWVRNRPDGSVEICAEGDELALQRLLDWSHHGPTSAKVSKISSKWSDAQAEFSDFEVRR